MITKSKLISTINELPNKFSFDDVIDKIVLLQKIEMGLEDSKNKRTFTTEEAKVKLKKWLR